MGPGIVFVIGGGVFFIGAVVASCIDELNIPGSRGAAVFVATVTFFLTATIISSYWWIRW